MLLQAFNEPEISPWALSEDVDIQSGAQESALGTSGTVEGFRNASGNPFSIPAADPPQRSSSWGLHGRKERKEPLQTQQSGNPFAPGGLYSQLSKQDSQNQL